MSPYRRLNNKKRPRRSLHLAPTTAERRLDLRAIFLTHHRRLYMVAYRLTASRHDAEDIVQEVFVRLHNKLEQFQQEIAFPLAAIEALPDSFRLDCVRVLECNGKKCVQFTCIKAGKVINIFQHALGQPWTLGQFAVARAPICNVECLLVSTQNVTAVSWKGNHSEYLTIGDLTPQEIAQVVQVLQ